MKEMKKQILFVESSLLISAGVTAQDKTQIMDKLKTQDQLQTPGSA